MFLLCCLVATLGQPTGREHIRLKFSKLFYWRNNTESIAFDSHINLTYYYDLISNVTFVVVEYG